MWAIVLTTCFVNMFTGLYMFPDPPLTPFLNQYFVEMDAAFGLLGTGSFALFCFYLIVCVIKGNVKVGFRLLLWTVYPMRLGNTLMSAFLVSSSLSLIHISEPTRQY